MSRFLCNALVLASLAVAIAVAAPVALAQSSNRMVVSIPFSFTVSGKTLPAGKYAIYRVSQTARAVMVENVEQGGGAAALIASEMELDGHASAKLVFRKYEDRYFLSQVWAKGSMSGTELARTSDETDLAGGHAPAVIVTLNIKDR